MSRFNLAPATKHENLGYGNFLGVSFNAGNASLHNCPLSLQGLKVLSVTAQEAGKILKQSDW